MPQHALLTHPHALARQRLHLLEEALHLVGGLGGVRVWAGGLQGNKEKGDS